MNRPLAPLRHLVPALGALLLAACAAPATAVPFGPQAWIDAPLDGAVLTEAPYLVTAHATHPDGVRAFVFVVNGSQESQTPVPADQAGDSLVHGAWDWTPAGPGAFVLEVYALAADGALGPSALAHVTVGVPTETPTQAEAPTPTSTSTPAALGLGEPTPSVDVFYYNRNECGPKMITIEVMLMWAGAGPAPTDVVMFARLAEMDGPGRTDWSALAMNAIGQDVFRRTLNSQTDIPGYDTYVHSWLQVQFVATRPGGAEAARSPVTPMLAELSRCPR